MEAESRRTLRLMPGAAELGAWLSAHRVPTAMVTRNSARTVAHFHAAVWPGGLPAHSPAISRDDPHPAKPDPAALSAIAAAWGLPLGPELAMVGDSPSNDVRFSRTTRPDATTTEDIYHMKKPMATCTKLNHKTQRHHRHQEYRQPRVFVRAIHRCASARLRACAPRYSTRDGGTRRVSLRLTPTCTIATLLYGTVIRIHYYTTTFDGTRKGA